jgi:pimeloyl-ACP methyl ester carboxylesterase
VERLVLVTPYDSLLTIAAGQFGFFPLRWLMLDKFESWRYAPMITSPTQLIAAQNDEVIPYASTKSLYDRFRPFVASMTLIPGVGHNSISESPEYISAIGGNSTGGP